MIILLVLGACIYFACAYVCCGFLLGYFQNDTFYSKDVHDKTYRVDLSGCVFFSMIPIMWLLAPFLTGFFKHGWMRPWLNKYPKKGKGQ